MGKEDPADQNDRSINFLTLGEAKGGATSYRSGVFYAGQLNCPYRVSEIHGASLIR